jgi:hypothetical protein
MAPLASPGFQPLLVLTSAGEPQALPSTPRDEPEEGSGAYRPYPYRQPVPQEQRGRASREHQVRERVRERGAPGAWLGQGGVS